VPKVFLWNLRFSRGCLWRLQFLVDRYQRFVGITDPGLGPPSPYIRPTFLPAWFTLPPGRRRQQVRPKRLQRYTTTHGVTSQTIAYRPISRMIFLPNAERNQEKLRATWSPHSPAIIISLMVLRNRCVIEQLPPPPPWFPSIENPYKNTTFI
jgi:hypothetical protein